jgi:hypothetical protein
VAPGARPGGSGATHGRPCGRHARTEGFRPGTAHACRTLHKPPTARREPLSSRSPDTPTTRSAHELGLANRGTAWHRVQNALKARRFAAVDDYRASELARLLRVEDALWPKAMAGNYRAGNAVLNVMDTRIRLLGPDQAWRGRRRRTASVEVLVRVVLERPDSRDSGGAPGHG